MNKELFRGGVSLALALSLVGCAKETPPSSQQLPALNSNPRPTETAVTAPTADPFVHERRILPVEEPRNFAGNEACLADLSLNNPDIGGEVEEYYKPLEYGVGFVTNHGSARNGIDGLENQGENLRHQMELPQAVNLGEWSMGIPNGSGPEYAAWATQIRQERGDRGPVVYDELTSQQQFVYRATDNLTQFIQDNLVDNQQGADPVQVVNTDEFIGFAALGSPNNIGKRYLVFSQNNPQDTDPKFLGAVIASDTASLGHWLGGDGVSGVPYGNYYYQQGFWNNQWIADISENVIKQINTGLSGELDNPNEGKPGMVFVSFETYQKWLAARDLSECK